MLKLNPQIIRSPSGEELVVLSRTDFDALVSRIQEDVEDAEDVAIFDDRMAALKAEQQAVLPADVSSRMLGGQSLLRALREWRSLTQKDIAARSSLAQGYISDLEARKKSGTPETLKLIAAALDVPASWLGVADSDARRPDQRTAPASS